ncbi:NAD(P)-binding domain-containing protein [Embleya sp. NPDC001921]
MTNPATNPTSSLPDDASSTTRVSLLGLGSMGTAWARAWLAAGQPLTVWNRTGAKADTMAAAYGAAAAPNVAAAVAASDLVLLCLLDDASVTETLEGIDLTGKDVVNLTTGTPAEGRARSVWARDRGARFLDAGIMAVPPMVGVPEAGGYTLYSGARDVFDRHRAILGIPTGARYVGQDAGAAALIDVALLSAMYGLFGGMTHAHALVAGEAVDRDEFAGLLTGWMTAMAGAYHAAGASGEDAKLEMQLEASRTLSRTATEQGVSAELIDPYFKLMERQISLGEPDPTAALRIPTPTT